MKQYDSRTSFCFCFFKRYTLLLRSRIKVVFRKLPKHLFLKLLSHKWLIIPCIWCPIEATRNQSHLTFDGLKQAGSTSSPQSSRNNGGQIFLQIQKTHPQCQHHSYNIRFRSAYFVSSPLMARETKLTHVGPATSGPHCPYPPVITGSSKTLTSSPLTNQDLLYSPAPR